MSGRFADAALAVSVLLAAVAQRYDPSAPLALVVGGLAASLITGFKQIKLGTPDASTTRVLRSLLHGLDLEEATLNRV